ncbi:NUDIX domain-containing protein [Thiolapillus sp.]|uniref:NUDIX domain-containing protein n=1 Tax=Thiolapillus sp. TaxID=2017437 RepID=UPI003AF9CCCE
MTGCIPEWKDRVLLCRRAIEPRYGLWTLPAGFMENEESALHGWQRMLEESTPVFFNNGNRKIRLSVSHTQATRKKLLALQQNLWVNSGWGKAPSA